LDFFWLLTDLAATEWLIFLLFIGEVPGSSIDTGAVYPDRFLAVFSAPAGKFRGSALN
jgi:hypothetical protein